MGIGPHTYVGQETPASWRIRKAGDGISVPAKALRTNSSATEGQKMAVLAQVKGDNSPSSTLSFYSGPQQIG